MTNEHTPEWIEGMAEARKALRDHDQVQLKIGFALLKAVPMGRQGKPARAGETLEAAAADLDQDIKTVEAWRSVASFLGEFPPAGGNQVSYTAYREAKGWFERDVDAGRGFIAKLHATAPPEGAKEWSAKAARVLFEQEHPTRRRSRRRVDVRVQEKQQEKLVDLPVYPPTLRLVHDEQETAEAALPPVQSPARVRMTNSFDRVTQRVDALEKAVTDPALDISEGARKQAMTNIKTIRAIFEKAAQTEREEE